MPNRPTARLCLAWRHKSVGSPTAADIFYLFIAGERTCRQRNVSPALAELSSHTFYVLDNCDR